MRKIRGVVGGSQVVWGACLEERRVCRENVVYICR